MKFFCNQIIKSQTKDYLNRQFVIVKELASDDNGAIYEAKAESSSYRSNVAIKISYNIKEQEETFVDWQIQQQTNNTQLIKFYEKIEHKQYKLTIMELGGCNLNEYLAMNEKSISDKFKIFIQMLKAIKFLNENDYVCEQIKTKNYVLVQNTFKLTGSGYKKRVLFMNSQFQTQKIYDIASLIYLFYEIYQGEQFLQVQNSSEINGIKNDWLSKLPPNQRQDITELIKQLLKNPDGLNYDQAIEKYSNLKSVFSQANQQKNNGFQQIQQPNTGSNPNSSINSILEVPTQQFPYRQFILTHQLGVGGEGVVFKATPNNESIYKTDVAVKIQNSIKDDEHNFIKSLIDYQNNQESNSFIKSNLIRLYELYNWRNKLLIVMELGGKNLYTYLTEKKYQPENEKLQICQQITQAISFLHKKQLIHRDIKPENFIQCGNIFKLIDFGLIKNKDQNVKYTKMVGTPLYQAPEIIKGSDQYSFSVDIWSLGCLFYEIFKYEPLFNCNTIDQVKNEIERHCNNQNNLNNQIDQLQIKQELKDLIKKMVAPIPNKRPTIEEVLRQVQLSMPIIQVQSIIPIKSVYRGSSSVQPQFIQQPQQNQFQSQIIQSSQEHKNKIASEIKQYFISLMREGNCSILESQAKELEQIIKNISDQAIQQCNECVENYLKPQQNKDEKKSSKNNPNYNNKLNTRIKMIPPKDYQNNTIDDDQPNFGSEIHGNISKIQHNTQYNSNQNQIQYNGFGQLVTNSQKKF